ncbi:MAG: family transposase, partial [Candidatus Hydrogenedentes bacterium]|nr:family transposase [Candidatus Hydrogenedentota bacterium]
GLSHVHLKDYRRYERLFYVVALAYIFLSAHGALAEAEGFDKGLKANTRKTRVINLLRIGYYFIRSVGQDFAAATVVLRELVQKNQAPNWDRSGQTHALLLYPATTL